MATSYCATINARDGANAPVPVTGLPGWTVYKKGQTEIYEITHNLNLSAPEADMPVVLTALSPPDRVIIERLEENSFTVSAWSEYGGPTATDFSFQADCGVDISPPSPPSGLVVDSAP